MSMAILKPLLGALTVTAGTVSIGYVIAFPETFGLETTVSVFVTSNTVVATVPATVPVIPGAGGGSATGGNGDGSVLVTSSSVNTVLTDSQGSVSNSLKINCKLKVGVSSDGDCSVFSSSNTNISTQKHVNIDSFKTPVNETAGITANSYYKIDISKNTWDTWSSKTNQKIVININGADNAQELTMLFAVRSKNQIIWAKKESDQQHYFVGTAATTEIEINKSSESDKSYKCSNTNQEDKFKACKIYDFESSSTTALSLATESTKVTQTKQYVISTDKTIQEPSYVQTNPSDNKQMKIEKINKAFMANDVLFILDK